MNIDDIEIGQEVFCTSLRETPPTIGNTAFRGIGHIGIVTSVFPLPDVTFIGHVEYDGEIYREFLTCYHLDELTLYSPPERVLQNAIHSFKEKLKSS